MSNAPHLMAVVPIAILLTASFFVLFTIRKIEDKGLRGFGYVVAGFLWLAALVVFAGAVFGLGKDFSGIKKCNNKPEARLASIPPHIMNQGNSPAMVMPAKGPVTKTVRSSGCSSCQGNKGIINKTE